MGQVYFKDIIISLIKAIDLVSYLLKDHHRRVAIISKYIGTEYGLDEDRLKNLVLAASLHDIGALSVKERDELIKMDVENPHPHAVLGAVMLKPFPYFKEISNIIKYHHISWDERHLLIPIGEEAPIESYILHLADRVDIYLSGNTWILDQASSVTEEIKSRSGSVFHPDIASAFESVSKIDSFWLDIENVGMEDVLDGVMKDENGILMTPDLTEQLAYTFSRVIDFRSPFTATHSFGVGLVAQEIGKLVELDKEHLQKLKISGFLHDIGKIGIPIEIIEKKGPLTEQEFNRVKAHAYYTNKILKDLKGFEDICAWASMHHERSNGNGYPFHLHSGEFSFEMEIVAFADIFTALTEDRPYRKGVEPNKIIEILDNIDKDCFGQAIVDVIKHNLLKLDGVRKLAQSDAFRAYQEALNSKLYDKSNAI